MFGYVRPDAPELKIKDFARYRACYCGLCHEIGGRYGTTARFVLNYDLVFLAMLLWHEEEPSEYCYRRCVPSFCRRRCVSCSSRPIAIAAGYSVILSYWKFTDSITDSGKLCSLLYRIARLFLKRAYRHAAMEYPEFDMDVQRYLSELSNLESQGEQSMDRAADKFALLLASAARSEQNPVTRRIMEQLLYHVGRIVYLADAYDDLSEDLKCSRYNPIAARFALISGKATSEVRESVRQTLSDSQQLVESAYALLPRNYWSSVTDNIIYLGLPRMCRDVLDGAYNRKRRLPRRPQSVLADRRENQ